MKLRSLRARFVGLALSALAVGCGGEGDEPSSASPAEIRSLPTGVIARAGDELVASATVARIAGSQRIGAAQALAHALSDALLAEGARAALPPDTVRSIERAAAARQLLESFAIDAARQGPATQAELDELLRERWVDLDRPAAARTVHAVVLNTEPARDAAARKVAEKLAESVQSALSAEDFVKRAKSVPTEGFELVAEELPFITADGRSFQVRDSAFVARPSGFDRAFASAANELQTVGEQSPIVKTSFGFHVIRLEAREPAAGVPASERATALAPEVMSRRAVRARKELLDRLRQSSTVTRDRAADDLTARLQKKP